MENKDTVSLLDVQQHHFGLILLTVTSLSLVVNLMMYYYAIGGIDGNFFSPSIIVLMCLIPLIVLTILVCSVPMRLLQVGILFGQSLVAIYDQFEAFWGWGFLIMTFILAYAYSLLEQNTRSKAIGAFTLVVCVGGVGMWRKGLPLLSSINAVSSTLFFVLMWSCVRIAMMMDRKKIQALDDRIELQRKQMKEIADFQNLQWSQVTAKKSFRIFCFSTTDLPILKEFYQSEGSLSNKEIAELLDTTESKVKNGFYRIMKKMDVRTRSEVLSRLHKLN